VHDGDTFHSGRVTIRLHGIDAPELGEPKALEATRRLAGLLRAGPVTIVPHAEDVYGRLVADVFVRGQNVADVLRREGLEKPRRL
jgi:endonuclease YncB( thermonuclease family)